MVAIIPQAYLDAKYAKNNRNAFNSFIECVYLFDKPIGFDRTKYTTIIVCFNHSTKSQKQFLNWKKTKLNFLKDKLINMRAKNVVATLSNKFYVLNDNFQPDGNYIRKGVWASGKEKS